MTRAAIYPVGAAVELSTLETDPHPTLARLRSTEPVSWLPALNAWLVSRRDLVVQVMRDPDTFTVDDPRFSTARVVGPSMLSLDGYEHGRHREPFDGPFGRSEVSRRFTGFVEETVDRLVTAIEPAGAVELRRTVAGPLAVAVVAEALGLLHVEAETVLTWYDAIVTAVSRVSAGEPVSQAGSDAFDQLRRSVEATMAEVGREPAGASATSLLVDAMTGGLRTPEVVSNAAVFMFGGIETTEGMISNLVWHLLGSPDQLALVREQPALLANAIEESLRLEPAAAVVDRYATRDIELGRARVEQGEQVVVSLAGANRDPAVFTDPDTFDVRRRNARGHVAFAHGPHVCLGMHLARVETEIVVRHLLQRLPGLRLDAEHPASPTGLVFRKPRSLRVRWDA